MNLNFENTRRLLNEFEFGRVFVDELGWSRPQKSKALPSIVKEEKYDVKIVAELSGVVVCEITGLNGIPDSLTRKAIHRDITKRHHENLLIFVDAMRTQSLWYWVKRVEKKQIPRDHLFCKGQPADLFLGKLNQMVFDLSEFDDDGNVSVVDVAKRLQDALDIDRVTKKFFRDFQEQHVLFLDLIKGIKDERQRRWYASVLLNRLMFIYFLQKKPPGFLDNGNLNYLRDKLVESKKRGKDRYYSEFLKALFFEGFAKEERDRSVEAKKFVGTIKYLNGGLFLPHSIERKNTKISIPDKAFENLFDLFERYSWHLDDTPGGQADEINPDVLGYIFEKYINQKAFGAYYTRPEITEYLCERTIHRLVLDAVKKSKIGRPYESLAELLIHLDAPLCHLLVDEVLPRLSLLDPACGSGAFLVAAMRTLINIYSALIGKIKFLKDDNLVKWLKKIESEHPSISYYIKKRVITDNLYGVDIMEEATEIARLRLFLALVSSAQSVDDLEPLPNIDFNILPGNSLIGLIHVDPDRFAKPSNRKLVTKSFLDEHIADEYRAVLKDKNESLRLYREHSFKRSDDAAGSQGERLLILRDAIQKVRQDSYQKLNWILKGDFDELGIKLEEAVWDESKNSIGNSKKRIMTEADVTSLHPFHWGFEFDQILNGRGGFDAIITNPPWEVFKPNAKEFFEDHSDLVSKKNMSIHEFEKEQTKLLKDPEIRTAWLRYLSDFPHQSLYFRTAPQYRNQVSVVNGKKTGSDINYYKLFVELCLNLLRDGGYCGIITPGGIYTDLGTKQLRDVLLSDNTIETLFGLSNEKFIFEGVHHAQKFCILSFMKTGKTESIRAAFRINPREAIASDKLDRFFHDTTEHVSLNENLIRRLSPDSLSVMEFKSDIDVRIAEKMLAFPLLGEELNDTWNVRFTSEFHMTNASKLFRDKPGKGRLPLYEGKMIWHFEHKFAEPRYWVDEKEGREALLGRTKDNGQLLDYQGYRMGFRDVASSTNERSAISAILPPQCFAGNTLPTSAALIGQGLGGKELSFLASTFNSFVFDWLIRKRITNHLNFFYVYQSPIPRLTEKCDMFGKIVERGLRLTCTTPEFDDLAKQIGLSSHEQGVSDAARRARLRAELDGLVAHLYGLTEEEFAHVLTTFSLVPDQVKVAAQNAYRDVAKGLVK
jgi:hypothetical protein